MWHNIIMLYIIIIRCSYLIYNVSITIILIQMKCEVMNNEHI